MRRAFYLTHPQVRIDPAVPVPQWGLSEVGAARARLAASAPWTGGIAAIVSSDERKAMEAAEIIGAAQGIQVAVRAGMHENDRSATGYLVPDEFERMADAFFAQPDESVRGWERAADAQVRIVAAISAEMGGTSGDVLFVGHGAVGTLLMCHLLGVPITRALDQPHGGGNVFCWGATTGRLLHQWLALEDGQVGVAA
jgi:broad specificity phosphatase PhoE